MIIQVLTVPKKQTHIQDKGKSSKTCKNGRMAITNLEKSVKTQAKCLQFSNHSVLFRFKASQKADLQTLKF